MEYSEELLHKYDLYEFKNKYPSQLSGGMRQRVALIRTLTIKPDILLLDEAFSALDYQTRLSVQTDISSILKSENKTAILVTHDISEAIAMSNKIIILKKRPGEIKKVLNLNFNKNETPIQRRNNSLFNVYFKTLWEELNE